jgi:HSP20 family protein
MMRSSNPWRLMDALLTDLTRGADSGAQHPFSSDVDVLEMPDSVLVCVNLPGVKPENVDLNLESNVLTMTAKLENSVPENAKVLWRERATGEMRRAVQIPMRVSHEGIQANLEQGVLMVRIPKAPEATAKRIEVGKTMSVES